MPAPCSRRTFLVTSALFGSALVTGCTGTPTSPDATETTDRAETVDTTMDDCEKPTLSTPATPLETRGALVGNNDTSEHTVAIQVFVFESPELSAEETREVPTDQMPCRSVNVFEHESVVEPDGDVSLESVVPVYDEQTNYWLTVTLDGDETSAFVFSASDETELGYLAIDVDSPTETRLQLAVR